MKCELRFLGLDLAWSARNPSGLAVLDAAGNLLDACADRRSDAEILAWVRSALGGRGVIGIDMPTIVPNATGMRPCERAMHAEPALRAARAVPYPANRGLLRPPEGRARLLVDALAGDGVVEVLDVRPGDARRRTVALEVFPHAAHVALFGRDRIFGYKRRAGRDWATVLDGWSTYRAALGSLRHADPPLQLDGSIPAAVAARGYKRWDDTLDAITCAYVASFVHRWGVPSRHVRIYGDLSTGYIVVPGRPVFEKASEREGGEREYDQR